MQPEHRPNPSLLPWARALIVAALVLALSLLAAASLPLSSPAAAPEPAQAEAEASEEEGEDETEFEFEEEGEEGEEEGLEGAHTVFLPPECILHTVQPSIAVQLEHGSVRLTLRYTSEEATLAKVTYWLKGGKGSLQLGSASRHLGERGVLHLSTHLDQHELAKARAARAFLVGLYLPDAAPDCGRYFTLRLTAKHQLTQRETWSLARRD
jgi:hypothetical protein